MLKKPFKRWIANLKATMKSYPITVESEISGGLSALICWFLRAAGILLIVPGAAKFWSALGDASVLLTRDPVLGLAFRDLFLAIGVVEMSIGGLCYFPKKCHLSLILVAWIGANFSIYRMCLFWLGWTKPCSCLGTLTDALHISTQFADNVMKGVLAFLLLGSWGLLFAKWSQERRGGMASGGARTSATAAGGVNQSGEPRALSRPNND